MDARDTHRRQNRSWDLVMTRIDLASLRTEVRQFVEDRHIEPTCDAWIRRVDPQFSQELGARGWVGMTLPQRYGGAGKSYVERYAVTEELLRAGAPVAAHWLADRQIGPTILRFGNTRLREEVLPGICAGTTYFCLALSEPDSGSDLSSLSLRAERVDGGWVLDGTKIWTSYAEFAHFVYVVARSSKEASRHDGMTEFVIPRDAPGLAVLPIVDITGSAHFNELVFDSVFVPDWRVVGHVGKAWSQVVSQLDFERSGPERLLSTYPLFQALTHSIAESGSSTDVETIGEIASEISVLRIMCRNIAEEMDRAGPPGSVAATVKDLGSRLEQRIGDVAAEVVGDPPRWRASAPALERLLAEALTFDPTFTLRGGTTEILRNIIARRELKVGVG